MCPFQDPVDQDFHIFNLTTDYFIEVEVRIFISICHFPIMVKIMSVIRDADKKYLTWIENQNIKIIYENDSDNIHTATYYPTVKTLVFRRRNENKIHVVIHEICHILDYQISKEEMWNLCELVACRTTCKFLSQKKILSEFVYQDQVSYSKKTDGYFILPRNHHERSKIEKRISRILEELNKI